MTKTHAKAGYSAKDITVLEGLEPVRLRPGMYIGSTGIGGLHHLIYEIVANSVDEALAIILTKLHAGGKFGGDGYKVSGGLHGVGASVVNALSDWLTATVELDGKTYRQEFARGVPQGPMQELGPSSENGTTISFQPDATIFDETEFHAGTLVSRLREMAFLTKGLRITFVDERVDGETVEFHYEGGIKDFVSFINESKDIAHKHVVYFESSTDQGEVEVAMQWNNSYQESVFSFANNINTHEGGSHLSGFKAALTRTLNDYARSKGLLKEEA